MATAYPGGLRKRGGLLDYEDTIQATPRNAFFGGVADLLGQAYKLPEMPRLGVPGLDFVAANRNRLMDLLGVGDVQKTAEAMSYGNRLGTGAGMTYRLLPETVGAAMAVAPFAGKAIRATEGLPVGASIKLVDDAAIFKDASVLINPKNLKPLNKVEDVEKYKTIVNSMEESGYHGRPILAYMDKGKAKALTGSHRIFAARKAGIDVPVVFVNPSVMKWEDKSGLFGTFKESINDQRVYNYLKAAGDDVAASLSKLEDQVVQPSMSPYPQAKALRLAQQRAALPVEQGGLGLPKAGLLAEEYMQGIGTMPGIVQKTPSMSVTDAAAYQGSHKAPGPDFGAPLHDLTGGGQMYPADVYSEKAAQYYGTGNRKADIEAFNLAKRVRGNPDAEVTMYRAVPKNVNAADINPGDWVTLSKDYAKTHGESVLDKNYKILSKKVKAKELWTNADSIQEFGYNPSGGLLAP